MANQLSRLGLRLRVMMSDPVRGFQFSVLLLALLIVFGSAGYVLIEEMALVDALYMTIITISTVGFGEIKPLSPPGRVFTSFLIFLGVTLVTTAISNAVSVVLGHQLWLAIQERKMEERLKIIEKHYLICGYGRMGQQVAHDLQARKQPFVVVERDAEAKTALLENDIPHIIGDGTQDETLLAAGIKRATGLVSALNNDADNVMTVLTAREMNPALFIVARAVSTKTETKLYRAGANRVVSPYQIGGHRMALALLRPAVHDFMRRLFHEGDGTDTDIGQAIIHPHSFLAGRTIAETRLRSTQKITILAVQKSNGELVINPDPQHIIEPGEVLIVIGPSDVVYQLEETVNAGRR